MVPFFRIDGLFGSKPFTRKTGEALNAERENLNTLEIIRAALGTYNFASQFQQTPAPSDGGLVKEAWFRRYGLNELPTSFGQIIQSWNWLAADFVDRTLSYTCLSFELNRADIS